MKKYKKLKDQITAWGELFFKNRINLPFLLIPFFILFIFMDHAGGGAEAKAFVWKIICLFVSLTGYLVRIIVVGTSPKNTSGRNTKRQKADCLVTKGFYSVVRNPLYLANIIILTGFALFAGDITAWLLTIMLAYFYYEKIIFVEEEFLARTFQKEFELWAQKTPMLFPQWGAWKASGFPFDLKRVLRKEYPGLMVIGMTFFGLNFIQDCFIYQRIYLDPFWSWFVIAVFMIWLILRTLKKYTKLLKSR
ncbi:hypothetical protein IIB34_01845 [PVC group bacterium]|nr:hypothetical protein [PVC group bacterium]